MIEYTTGNILEIDADYVVIPVNCVGKPGKGLALEWAQSADARIVQTYKNECHQGKLIPGDIRFFHDSSYILAATKDHWVQPSRLEWIDRICEDLCYLSISNRWFGDNHKVVALPKLGCGNGLLRWRDVHEIMVTHLTGVPTTFLICYNQFDELLTRR